jgi:8-oxo-dGTP pyrophosphatase MutT (NUDIX family)
LTDTDIIEKLRKRLKQPLPGRSAQEKMIGRVVTMPLTIPANARPSAVLCLLYPVDGQLQVLLMKRREDNTPHSGQVSFPGGSYEASDHDLQATALREAFEEVGIVTTDVDILGELTSLYIPVSNFKVQPFIGYTPHRPVFNLSHAEVAHTLEVPLSELLKPELKTIARVVSPAFPDVSRSVNAYLLPDGAVIWGATAMIISELEAAVMESAVLGI